MDGTDFVLLVGWIGACIGASLFKVVFGWSLWIAIPIGGLVGMAGLLILTALAIALITCIDRLIRRLCRRA